MPTPVKIRENDLWVNTITIGSVTLNESDVLQIVQTGNATLVGTAPATAGLACTVNRLGNKFTLTFTLTALSIAVTDAGASGSFGATKLFDFVEGSI